jgi:hypothetical protein
MCWAKFLLLDSDMKFSRMDKIVSYQELTEHINVYILSDMQGHSTFDYTNES